MEKTQISSLKELQLQMPRIVEEYGNNNELTAIALANPLLALEKIGYTFSPEAKTEIENHVRFGKENASRYMTLKKNIEQSVGAKIDVDDTQAVKQLLEKELKKSAPGDKEKILSAIDKPVSFSKSELSDPLQKYKSQHPVLEQLVELRKLQALNPPLATQESIEKIQKSSPSFFNKISFRISRKK